MSRLLAILISLASMHSAFALDYSLLESRKWKSSDGKALDATLVKYEGDWLTLKRKSDNRDFTLPITRFSVDDRALLEKCGKELRKIIDDSDGHPSLTGVQFTGFSDPGEQMWELACRMGLHRKLWDRATGANWFHTIAGSHRVIRLKPQRFERISDLEYYVHGEYVSLKVRLDDLEEKLSTSGDKLLRTDSGEKRIIAQRDLDFLPQLRKENLLSLKVEKVGVVERLVMSVSLGD